MFNGQPYNDEFLRRISTIRRLLDAGDLSGASSSSIDVSREMRGIAILLLFASYENLLKSLCRGLLERAARLRVGNYRLRTGLRQFAVQNFLDSIADSPDKTKMWITGREMLDCASSVRTCTIDTNKFPSDGSFMKRSQVKLVFDLFELGDPGSILRDVWDRLDTIVSERNKIAHGGLTPEEVGRGYTNSEIRDLVNKWESGWTEVISFIEAKAAERSFYRN